MKRDDTENLLLLGDDARSARYVGICRDKARLLARMLRGNQVLSARMGFRDGWAIIKVAKGRRKIIIYTEAGQASYEFFTSALIHSADLHTPPYDGYNNPNYNIHRIGASMAYKW